MNIIPKTNSGIGLLAYILSTTISPRSRCSCFFSTADRLSKLAQFPGFNVDSGTAFRGRNLSFVLNNWKMNVYPVHPQLQRINATTVQVVCESNVLLLVFLNYQPGFTSEQIWKNRKVFNVSFPEMTKLLTEEGEVLIEQIKQQSGDQENNLKRLHVQEDNKARVRRWKIQSISRFNSNTPVFNWEITAEMSPLDYCLLLNYLRQNLLYLSGCQLMLDHQREDALQNLKMNAAQKETIDSLFE